MRAVHLSTANLVFLGVMLIGLVASAFHASGGRWGNALIAGSAALFGIIMTLSGVLESATDTTPTNDVARTRAQNAEFRWIPDTDTPRQRWLSASITAGFAATIVMTLALVIAYLAAGYFAVEDGGQLSQWFWNLTHNDVTHGVFDVPIAAGSINVLAGLAWAVIYGAAFESRLRGPGWLRGMAFALVPFLLSVLVFFPIIGAGILGVELNAGPLPVLGNLVLHLLFGFTLGAVYGLPELSDAATPADARMAHAENDGIAIGLVLGLTVGLVLGAAAGLALADEARQALNVTLAGGAVGVTLGGMLGAFAGIEIGGRREGAL